MNAAFFVMAILGCGDASMACTPVTTMPTFYPSREACLSASDAALDSQGALDFPEIRSECRPASAEQMARLRAPTNRG